MKVLQLISSGGFYGAESVLLNLSVELQRMGHGCIAGVFENSGNTNTEVGDRAELAGFTVHRIPCRGRMDWGAIGHIRKIVEVSGTNLIHAHGYKADFYGLLAARLTETPVVGTCHNWLGQSGAMRAYARLDRFLLRFFDGVATVSQSVAEQLLRSGAGHNVRVIPNGVPMFCSEGPSEFVEQIRQADRTIVGTVGRLSPEKGMSFLIQAASRICPQYPQVFFVVVGDGPLRSELETQVRELGMGGQFLFTGERQDVQQILRSFDVYVLPSLQEALPMALLEAMAAGLPSVATRVGAVPDVLNDPRVGTLVEPADADAIASGIRDLLNAPSRRAQIGSNARKRVEDEFSAAAMAQKYAELYQQVMAERREGDQVATPELQAGTEMARRPRS